MKEKKKLIIGLLSLVGVVIACMCPLIVFANSIPISDRDIIISTRYYIDYDMNTTDAVTNIPQRSISFWREKGNVTTDIPKRVGYKFKGWNTQADGKGVSYKSGDQIVLTEAIKLYAQWETNKLIVKYNINDGLVATWNPYIAANSNGDIIFNGRVVTETFDYGTYLPNSGFQDYNNTDYIAVEKPGYTGVKGKEWCTTKDGTGKTFDQTKVYKVSEIADLSEGDVSMTLYVNWRPKEVLVTFHRMLDASDTVIDQQTFIYDVKNQKFSDKQWSKTGYNLTGWDTSKDSTAVMYAVESDVINPWIDQYSPEIDLYAVWKPIKYTVVFDGNGATGGSTPSINVKYDQTWNVPDNGFTKGGAKFLEWNTEPDGTGVSYAPGTNLKNLTDKDGEVITLYAIWEEELEVVYRGNGATEGSLKSERIREGMLEEHLYTIQKNENYTDYGKKGYAFDGWWETPKTNYLDTYSKFYRDGNVNQVTWEYLIGNAAASVNMPFRAVGFSSLARIKAASEVRTVPFYAQWDKEPNLNIANGEEAKALRTYYEGQEITKEDLLKGVTVTDMEDDQKNTPIEIKVVKIEYASGKLVDGEKQPGYTVTFKDGMKETDFLDTWFLEMEKNSVTTKDGVCHKVTYEVTDSAGNTVQAVGDVYVKYNNFPVITAGDRFFTLEEAQSGMINEELILHSQLESKDIKVSDEEEGIFNTPGDGAKKVNLLDFDAEELKAFTEPGYRMVTIHTQDSYGPDGLGKETTKQIIIYIMKDGEIPDVNKAKEVRFIDKKNYDKNKDVNPETMTEEEIEQRNANGGLNVNSKWYHNDVYRTEIENTFDKTTGTQYDFTLEEIEKVKEYIKEHGIGNMKEEDALKNFADQFLKK